MRGLLYLLIIGAGIYGFVFYVPAETRERALAVVGLSNFFQETLPGYLRSKFSIPENPIVKRERLLAELSGVIGSIDREIGAVAPPAAAVPPPPSGGAAKMKSPPPPSAELAEIRERVEKTKELITESESILAELEKANPQQGFVAKAAERLLDRVLPPPAYQAAGNGVGGDAAGGTLCPQ
ncbi:MAG: hypothetical protein Q8R35_03605 [bacterium]|nr:hypothetical protein [bacterium]